MGDLARDAARLRRGLVYTFAAVAVVALATASGWWPQPAGGNGASAAVSIEATNGQRLCGTLVDAGPGRIGVTVNGSPVAVSLADVATIAPGGSC